MWSFWIRQSPSDKTVFGLRRSPLFIAPPSYNECKPGGGGDSSSDEEEKTRRKEEEAEKDSSGDEGGEESGARQSYAPKYMTYSVV